MSDYDRLGYRDDILGRVRALAGAVKMRQVRNTKALTFAEMSQDAGAVAIDGLLFADTEFTGDPIGEENGLAWVDEDGNASAIIGTFHDAGTGHVNFQIVVPAIIGEINLISDYTQISTGIGGRVDTGTHFIDGSYAVVAEAGAWKAYGLYIFGPAGTGEVGDTVTRYALYIADPAAGGTINYSIYTNEGLNRLGDQLTIVGSGDRIQLIVKGNATQTENLAELQDSAGVFEAGFDMSGGLILREKGDAPNTPGAGTWIAYFKADGMYIKDDAGVESGPFGSAGPPDASAVTYTPADNSKWTGNADPGNTDDALDQLAGRMTTEEGHTHAAPDASVVTFTPADNSKWTGNADPGNTDDALDQLAGRTKTLEDTSGTPDASVVTYTPAVNADWSGSADPGNADDAFDQLASRVTDVEAAEAVFDPENLTSQVNGTATHFIVATPFLAGSLQVVDNGATQNYASITEDVGLNGFTLDYAPPAGHQLFVNKLTSTGGAASLASTWAAIQVSQLVNEIKGWPPSVPLNSDLDALNLWWDKQGTPTTAPTVIDVSAAGLTDDYETALKVVADAASEGLYQRWTYADEPRVKSGRKLSALVAIWSVSAVSVTAKLVNSDATHTDAAAVTAAGWTIVEVPNHVLAGTYCDLQITAAAAGTFYVVPLGANIGARAFPLRPRTLVYRRLNVPVDLLGDVNHAARAQTTLNAQANTSKLAVQVRLHLDFLDNTSSDGWDAFLYVKVGDAATYANILSIPNVSGTRRMHHTIDWVLDDAQQFDYSYSRWTGSGTLEEGHIYVYGWWEWE